MGDKAVSKEFAKKVGIPVVPGSTGAVPTIEEAIKIADQIKYPILLKAVAGGGGRGMRVCHNEQDVRNNFETVQREAAAAFKNGDLLVEKYIEGHEYSVEGFFISLKENVQFSVGTRRSLKRHHRHLLEMMKIYASTYVVQLLN
jgi:biotin carboxylase